MVRFFLVLCLLLPATMVEAATFYHCLDETGNETLLSFPIDGQHCKPVKTNEDRETPVGIHQENISSQQRTTKITVKGNQIFIPVTLVYGGRDVDVNLLMDTGATATTIHSHVADQFYVNLSSAEKAKGQVVGGGVIEASVIPLDFLKIGPYTIARCNVFVVPNEGHAFPFDGLLGMDVLGRFSYKIDLNKQVIIWE